MASLFGALVFSAVVVRAPPDTPASRLLRRRLGALVRGSLALALLVPPASARYWKWISR